MTGHKRFAIWASVLVIAIVVVSAGTPLPDANGYDSTWDDYGFIVTKVEWKCLKHGELSPFGEVLSIPVRDDNPRLYCASCAYETLMHVLDAHVPGIERIDPNEVKE